MINPLGKTGMLGKSVSTANATKPTIQYFLFTFKAEDEISYLSFAQEAKVSVEREPGGMQKGFVQLLNPLQHTKTCSYHAD
jgi:hypothetical protein